MFRNIRNRLAKLSSLGDLNASELNHGPGFIAELFAEKQRKSLLFISASGISSNKKENLENAATKRKHAHTHF